MQRVNIRESDNFANLRKGLPFAKVDFLKTFKLASEPKATTSKFPVLCNRVMAKLPRISKLLIFWSSFESAFQYEPSHFAETVLVLKSLTENFPLSRTKTLSSSPTNKLKN